MSTQLRRWCLASRSQHLRSKVVIVHQRLRKLAGIALRPSLWPVLALGVAPALEHRAAFPTRNYDLVVDAGANKGQFAAFAASRWPGARLICYEPLPGPRRLLTRVLKSVALGRAEVRPRALGAEAGSYEMHVATREDSSSLLALGDDQQRLFGMKESGTTMVTVVRLDTEPGLDEGGSALLKIDVQGFEYELLLGTGEALRRFDSVYVECSFVELYEGQRLAPDVIAYLESAGFRQAGSFNAHVDHNRLIQADLLFNRV